MRTPSSILRLFSLLAVLAALTVGATSSASAAVTKAQASPQSTVSTIVSDGTTYSIKHVEGHPASLGLKLPHGMRWAKNVTGSIVTPVGRFSATSSSSPGAHPDTGSGCTPYGGTIPPYVCIFVNGSGLSVTYWTTSSYISGHSPVSFYEQAGLVTYYNDFSDIPDGINFLDPIGWSYDFYLYLAGSPIPIEFPSQKVCNFWSESDTPNALPCLTIHS
jgi:hypothetical protein